MRLGRTDVNSDSLSCLLTWGGEDVTPDGFSIEPVEIVGNGED